MTEKTGITLPPEDKERVMRLTEEVFVPQLQEALKTAKQQAPLHEVLSASASAYARMLEMTIGRDAGVTLLQGLASHLASQPPSTRQ